LGAIHQEMQFVGVPGASSIRCGGTPAALSGLGNTPRGPTNLKHRSGSAAQVQAEAAVELRILRQIAPCFPVIPYQA